MTTRRMLQLLFPALLLAGLAAAQQKTLLTGYLMDKACSADAIAKGEKVAKAHDKGCALMDDCAKSGFGVLVGAKFLTFDAAGNKRAIAALRESQKATDLRVEVVGEVTGDAVKVASLKLL